MLTISLDEYGRFENTRPGRCMIAGVVYEAAGNGRAAELNRIQAFLQKACADCNVRYPQDLHYERSGNMILNKDACDRVKNHIAGKFQSFIRDAGGTYYIYAVVSERRGISMFADPSASNLLRDDYAGNKYLHMTQMAVRNLVVNNPVIQDNSYHLELATRVLNVGQDSELKSQTEHLGMSRPIGANNARAQGVYTLTDVNTYISALSGAILENERRDVDFKLNVQSINYSGAGDISRLQGFLYLADIVCSLLEAVIPGDGGTAQRVLDRANSYTTHTKNMVWCYDDVDVLLWKAQQKRLAGKWLDSLDALYDITTGTTPQSAFYARTWVPMQLQRLRQDVTPAILEQAARELADYVMKPGAGTGRAWYLAEQLLDILSRHDTREYNSCRYWLYSAMITLCNHRGKSDQAAEYYQKAMAHAGSAPMEVYLELRNAYSVFLLDRLKFGEALENTKRTLAYEELADDLRQEFTEGQNMAAPHLGRTLSQLGQCHAFLEDHPAAQDAFRQALEKYHGEETDTQITRSYLLHSYIESNSREEYLALCRDYFGADTLQSQLEQVGNMTKTSRKYALFVLVKGWHRFRTGEVSSGVTRQLLNRILRMREDRGEHPWELISKYCALIAREKKLDDTAEAAVAEIRAVAARGHSGILDAICANALLECGGDEPEHKELTYMYR